MIKASHRIKICIPFEMQEMLDGDLFSKEVKVLLKSLRKYITVFCLVPLPEDMEIIKVVEDYDSAAYYLYVASLLFPKLSPGCSCTMYNLTDRDSLKSFFSGL